MYASALLLTSPFFTNRQLARTDSVIFVSQIQQRVLQKKRVPTSEKVVSLSEPDTRTIPRHNGGADVEFGQMVGDEVEGRIITRFDVLADKTAKH